MKKVNITIISTILLFVSVFSYAIKKPSQIKPVLTEKPLSKQALRQYKQIEKEIIQNFNLEKGVKVLTKMIKRNKMNPKLYALRGKCYMVMAKFDESLKDLATCMKFKSRISDYDMWYVRAMMASGAKDFLKNKSIFSMISKYAWIPNEINWIINNDKKNKFALLTQAQLLLMAPWPFGNETKGFNMLRKLLKKDKYFFDARLTLANYYRDKKKNMKLYENELFFIKYIIDKKIVKIKTMEDALFVRTFPIHLAKHELFKGNYRKGLKLFNKFIKIYKYNNLEAYYWFSKYYELVRKDKVKADKIFNIVLKKVRRYDFVKGISNQKLLDRFNLFLKMNKYHKSILDKMKGN